MNAKFGECFLQSYFDEKIIPKSTSKFTAIFVDTVNYFKPLPKGL